MMKIGVWGDGFIGKNLAITLAENNSNVCILNRKGEVKARAGAGDIPAHAMSFEDNEQEMRDAMTGLGVLVHCAGNAQQDYDSYHQASLRMARAAVAAKVSRVIIFSTVAVYGAALPEGGVGNPFLVSKDLEPAPVTPYALSRFKTETEVRSALEGGGVSVTIVRIPMAIGPGMNAVVFKKLAGLLRKGVFPHFSAQRTTLPCIGIQRLSQCLSRIALDATLDQPLYQIADNVSWTDITDRFRSQLGLSFRSVPLPGRGLYAVLNMLGRVRLASTVRSLINTAEYADDSYEILGNKNSDKWPTMRCIEESITALGE